jgi:hypothetical protein
MTRIWKLVGAFCVAPLVCVIMPLIFSHFGWIDQLNPKAGIILFVTVFGIVIKIVCADIATGTFEYHKHGHDFCVLTMGGALSAGSVQLMSKTDQFPGIARAWPWKYLDSLTEDVIMQRLIVIGIMFCLSCFFAFATARISRAIREENPPPNNPDLLSLINFTAGTALFSVYLLFLITKG